MWLWYLDRGSALVAWSFLWLATLSGALHAARGLGALQAAAKRLHTPASVVAMVALLVHVVAGVGDAWLVATRRVPHPAYGDAWFATGVFVGVAALALLATAVLALLDARRFARPWDPRGVHALAYAAFAFATLHAAAVGSDALAWAAPAALGASALILLALLMRGASRTPTAPAGRPPGDP